MTAVEVLLLNAGTPSLAPATLGGNAGIQQAVGVQPHHVNAAILGGHHDALGQHHHRTVLASQLGADPALHLCAQQRVVGLERSAARKRGQGVNERIFDEARIALGLIGSFGLGLWRCLRLGLRRTPRVPAVAMFRVLAPGLRALSALALALALHPPSRTRTRRHPSNRKTCS